MKAWMLLLCVFASGCSYHRVAIEVQVQGHITPVIPVHVTCKVDLEKGE